jgi:uroporphyrinogen III methyltransferase / synthase
MTRFGVVFLVGAGPGDPGLLTLKGREVLSKADVVVYDYLANPALLSYARHDAEMTYVGKQAGCHAMKQDDINALLVSLAQSGKSVCRLKGGDPFVFGRGGEEALALAKAGVPIEVVPGVSAASAVAAYAGIPITHRGLAASFLAITGHEDPTKEESDLDWPSIAQSKATLVFFMGVKNIRRIADELQKNGRPSQTPVALIRQGTQTIQKTLIGTLADIGDKTEAAGMKPPALLVVGEVVSLREKINWFETKPLFGTSIIVTRSRAQAGEISGRLAELGANVIELPAIRIEAPRDPEPLRRAMSQPDQYDWIIFTSVNGVDFAFAELKKQGKDARAFGQAQVCAIGPATADRLAANGICADLVPDRYIAEAILDSLLERGEVKGKRFLLPRADLARPALADGLKAKGGRVEEVIAYHTVAETPDAASLDAVLSANVATFASSSTVRNFANLVGEERLEAMRKNTAFVSIGPITTQTMQELNIPVTAEALVSTIPGIVDAVCKIAKI